jgi:hypothetical protein
MGEAVAEALGELARLGDRVVELRRLGLEISSEGLKPRARYLAIDGLPSADEATARFTFRSQS